MNYQNGKIYKITNCIDNDGYIGSTCQTLSKRWYEHKCRMVNINKNHFLIYQHMLELGRDKFCISLIEDYPCNNRTELLCREGQFIRELSTLNTVIEGRTKREWIKDNKERVAEKQKEYREKNREQMNKTQKKCRETNKEKSGDSLPQVSAIQKQIKINQLLGFSIKLKASAQG